MFRKLIPLAVAVVVVIGCKKKAVETADDGKVDSDPNATYTIKIRDEQAGDKVDVVEVQTGSGERTFGGKTDQQKEDRKYEFTEHIVDHPAGSPKPTKITRAYKTAQRYDKATNGLKAAKFEGKTVLIEKKGVGYDFTVDGKRVDFLDAIDLSKEFRKTDKQNINEVLPKSAVKVGESWPIELAALKALMGALPYPVDVSRSKLSGKLTRAYTKDGKQWGVVALEFDLVIDSAVAPVGKGVATGTMKIDGTFDAVIDGSSREGTHKLTVKLNVTGKEGPVEVKVVADMTNEKTVRPVK